MRSLYFVSLLLVSLVSVSHVGPVFASPTLTIVIVANNGPRTVDLRIAGLVPHPWGSDWGDNLYGWAAVNEQLGVSVANNAQKTLSYDLSPGVYNINISWVADVGGLMMYISQGQLVELSSDATVTFVAN
jgi:hypothetical protein